AATSSAAASTGIAARTSAPESPTARASQSRRVASALASKQALSSASSSRGRKPTPAIQATVLAGSRGGEPLDTSRAEAAGGGVGAVAGVTTASGVARKGSAGAATTPQHEEPADDDGGRAADEARIDLGRLTRHRGERPPPRPVRQRLAADSDEHGAKSRGRHDPANPHGSATRHSKPPLRDAGPRPIPREVFFCAKSHLPSRRLGGR